MIRDYTLTYTIDASGAAAAFTVINDGFRLLQKNTFFATNDLTKLEAQLAALGVGLQAATVNIAAMNAALHTTGATHIHLGDNIRNTTEQTKAMNAGVMGGIVAFQGLAQVIDTIGELGEKIAEVRKKTVEMAEAAMGLRQEMRELANLKGADSPDDEVVASTVEFGIQAGMKPMQAKAYLEQYLGSNPAGLQRGNIGDGKRAGESQDEYEKRVSPITASIAKAGAQFGQRVGLQPSTAGDITGVLSQFEHVGSGTDASQTLGQITEGLNAGRGHLEPLMRVLANTAGAIVEENGGGIGSLNELSVMLGMMSTHHAPTQAGTYLKKATREIRQAAMNKGELGEKMRQMNVGPNDSTMEAMKKMGPTIAKAEAEGITPDNWARSIGFKDEAAIQAVYETYKDQDLYKLRMEKSKAITGKSVETKNDNFFNVSLTGIKQKQDATDEGSKYLRGQKAEMMQLARQAAITRMRDSGSLNSVDQQLADKAHDIGGITGWLGLPDSFQERIDEEARSYGLNQARNAGYSGQADKLEAKIQELRSNRNPAYNVLNRPKVQQATEDFYNEVGPKVLKRGLNPFGDGGGVLAKTHDLARSEQEKANFERLKTPYKHAKTTQPVDLVDPATIAPPKTGRKGLSVSAVGNVIGTVTNPKTALKKYNQGVEAARKLRHAQDPGRYYIPPGKGRTGEEQESAGKPDPVMINPRLRIGGPKGPLVPMPADAAAPGMRVGQAGGGGGADAGSLKEVLTALLEETRRQHDTIRDAGGMPLPETPGYGPMRA